MSVQEQTETYGTPAYEADYLLTERRQIDPHGTAPIFVDGFSWSAHIGTSVTRAEPHDNIAAVDDDTIVARGVVDSVESDARIEGHIIHVIPP